MAAINHWTIIGNVGRDATISHGESGTPMVSFSLAIDGRGRGQEPTWVAVLAVGRLAEALARNGLVGKGALALVVGRAELDQWRDREGERRVGLLCVASHVQVLQPSPEGVGVLAKDYLEREESYESRFARRPGEYGPGRGR